MEPSSGVDECLKDDKKGVSGGSNRADCKVFYRITPTARATWEYVKVEPKERILVRRLQEVKDERKARREPHFWEFKTDGVFKNCSQEDLYLRVTKNILEQAMRGSSSVIVAYGQTGTGKSLTLAGLERTVQDLGISPRLAKDLFKLKEENRTLKIAVQVSYVEFTRYGAIDLLRRQPNELDKWHVREEVTKIKVKNMFDALKLLCLGEARKMLANVDAYPSHLHTSVLTFHVSTRNNEFSEPLITSSRIHVIDMAGVDTVGNLTSIFKSSNEIGEANLIKTNFAHFFVYLTQLLHRRTKANRRINPLVYFLGEDLGGSSSMRFIGHIKVNFEDLTLTLSILRFGCLLKGVRVEKRKLDHSDDKALKLKLLEEKVERMQKEAVLTSMLLNQDFTALNEDRMMHLKDVVDNYLKDLVDEISVLNVAEAVAVFRIFKDMHFKNAYERDAVVKQLKDQSPDNSSASLGKGKRGSKGSQSRSSLRSKRISKKSGDSLLSAKPKPSGETERAKSASTLKVKALPKPTSKLKLDSRSVTSSSHTQMNKRKATTKRTNFGSCGSLLSELIPETVPENEEAWREYSETPTYKALSAGYQDNEQGMKELYYEYRSEVKKLQTLKNSVEDKKEELLEATLVKNYNVSMQADAETISFLEESEIVCKENLARAETQLRDHQEMVLNTQTELKLSLKHRKELKKRVNEEFENYCKTKYNIPLVNSAEFEGDIDVKSTPNLIDREERPSKEEDLVTELEQKLHEFQTLLKLERERYTKAATLTKVMWRTK